jgi:8-oxo-dGTP diphosphatase
MVMIELNRLKLNPLLVVAAAIINPSGEILVQRRPDGRAHAGLWEFPGGKVDQGESLTTALVRELREELGMEVAQSELSPLSFSSQIDRDRELILLLFACRNWKGDQSALHADEIKWVSVDALTDLKMPPADVPLIPALRRLILST